MIRRPPRSTLDRSSAASDVYKRQDQARQAFGLTDHDTQELLALRTLHLGVVLHQLGPVSYTHLRAHETVLDLVCRLLLEKKTPTTTTTHTEHVIHIKVP